MAQLLLTFFALSAVIVVAGIYLAQFGDVLADKSGLGGSLVGMILIASATSLPELAVNCAAASLDAADLAVGAIVGSSLFNLLILGLMEFLHGSSHRIISPASSSHTLSAIASLIMTAILAFFILFDDPVLVANFGLGPVLVILAYLFCVRLIFLEQQRHPATDEGADSGASLSRAVIGFIAMTAIIFVAASWLAPTAEQLAEKSGLGDTFVGTTFVAITTSLPELVTTLAAVRMGSFDMAVGNIFGSNAFNAAMLLPIDGFYLEGPVLSAASPNHAITASAVLIVTSVILAAMHFVPRRRIPFLNPDAYLVVALSIASLVAIYFAST